MEKNQQQFSLWYFILTFFILTAVHSLFLSPRVENLIYSDFKTLLKKAQTIGEEIQLLLKEPHDRVKETLEKKRPVLEALKIRLLEKEVVERLELEELIKEYNKSV